MTYASQEPEITREQPEITSDPIQSTSISTATKVYHTGSRDAPGVNLTASKLPEDVLTSLGCERRAGGWKKDDPKEAETETWHC